MFIVRTLCVTRTSVRRYRLSFTWCVCFAMLVLRSRRIRRWRSIVVSSIERLMLWDFMLTRTAYAALVVLLFRTGLAFSRTLQTGAVRLAATLFWLPQRTDSREKKLLPLWRSTEKRRVFPRSSAILTSCRPGLPKGQTGARWVNQSSYGFSVTMQRFSMLSNMGMTFKRVI